MLPLLVYFLLVDEVWMSSGQFWSRIWHNILASKGP